MTEKDYKPVSCDYHDELEAASMHKKDVELEFTSDGVAKRERGKIADVYSADGAEFVKFDGGKGAVAIRLDQITAFKEL
jgi:Rho-binding antiterminator